MNLLHWLGFRRKPDVTDDERQKSLEFAKDADVDDEFSEPDAEAAE